MMKTLAAAAIAAAALGLAGCGDSAEESGENLDSAFEEATQGEENLGDGPLERVGEDVDEATDNDRSDDAADALGDATDGDPGSDG